MTPDPYAEEYRGPAVLTRDDQHVDAVVVLAGHMEPIDGRYHWYGRVTADAAVTELARGRAPVTIALPGGEPVAAKLGEVDPWGNVRITGSGTPPYPLETLDEIEAGSR